jgi:release factor glutamine methyltransferase
MIQVNTVGEWQKEAEKLMSSSFSASESRHQARLLIEYVTEIPFSQTILFAITPIDSDKQNRLTELLTEVLGGKPIQYILGKTEFAGIEIELVENVLIPRPETEELVNWIVSNSPESFSMHDFCTGSGCIALAVKSSKEDAIISASDYSELAVEQAKRNAEKLNLDVDVLKIDALAERNCLDNDSFDVIVSNPPYIPCSEKKLMSDNVLKHEPHMALFVKDHEVLVFYEAICKIGQQKLKTKGLLYFEIHEDFAPEMSDLMLKFGFHKIEHKLDMQGKSRMIRGQKK